MPIITLGKSVGLNAENERSDVIAVKRRLIELGFEWLDPNEVMGGITVQAIILFQAIKNGFNRVTDRRNDGCIDPNGDTLRWLCATNAPRWQVMPAGSKAKGFINDELAQTNDNHDYGVSWLAETIQSAGATYKSDYHNAHPQSAVIRVNDISLPRGGPTPMHETHQSGLCCDIRLPRKDGGIGGITVADSLYDRTTMRAILKALRKQKLTSRILLNDQTLVNQGLCIPASGHDNHAHLEIRPPVRELPITP
jgi:hypothetical protein